LDGINIELIFQTGAKTMDKSLSKPNAEQTKPLGQNKTQLWKELSPEDAETAQGGGIGTSPFFGTIRSPFFGTIRISAPFVSNAIGISYGTALNHNETMVS
jgi:hypothetical protein